MEFVGLLRAPLIASLHSSTRNMNLIDLIDLQDGLQNVFMQSEPDPNVINMLRVMSSTAGVKNRRSQMSLLFYKGRGLSRAICISVGSQRTRGLEFIINIGFLPQIQDIQLLREWRIYQKLLNQHVRECAVRFGGISKSVRTRL